MTKPTSRVSENTFAMPNSKTTASSSSAPSKCKEVTPEEIKKCYGKKRIIDRVDQCRRRKHCPWAEPCLNCANEKASAIHFHLAHVSVGDMLFDPDDLDESGVGLDDNETSALLEAIDKEDASGGKLDADEPPPDIELEGITIPGEFADTLYRVLEKIAAMYFSAPVSFEVLMRKVFQGQNQSDVARKKKITRQGVNKRMLQELGIDQKRNSIQERRDRELAEAKANLESATNTARNHAAAMKDMTEAERKIYKICCEDGCLSVSSVAKQTGYSRKHIYTTLHFLREKYGIRVTLSAYSRKKK